MCSLIARVWLLFKMWHIIKYTWSVFVWTVNFLAVELTSLCNQCFIKVAAVKATKFKGSKVREGYTYEGQSGCQLQTELEAGD